MRSSLVVFSLTLLLALGLGAFTPRDVHAQSKQHFESTALAGMVSPADLSIDQVASEFLELHTLQIAGYVGVLVAEHRREFRLHRYVSFRTMSTLRAPRDTYPIYINPVKARLPDPGWC